MIYAMLKGDTTLTALVGDRIRPVREYVPIDLMTEDEKADNLPYMTYRVSMGNNNGGINFSTTVAHNIELHAYSLDAQQASDIQAAWFNLLNDKGDDPIQGIF